MHSNKLNGELADQRDQVPHVGAADPSPSESPIFTFSKPLKMLLNSTEVELHGVGMREFGQCDLPLLDRHHGQPVALAQNVVAALCDLTLDQVRALELDDFTMLADEALWQVSLIAEQMGLPADHFVRPPFVSPSVPASA